MLWRERGAHACHLRELEWPSRPICRCPAGPGLHDPRRRPLDRRSTRHRPRPRSSALMSSCREVERESRRDASRMPRHLQTVPQERLGPVLASLRLPKGWAPCRAPPPSIPSDRQGRWWYMPPSDSNLLKRSERDGSPALQRLSWARAALCGHHIRHVPNSLCFHHETKPSKSRHRSAAATLRC